MRQGGENLQQHACSPRHPLPGGRGTPRKPAEPSSRTPFRGIHPARRPPGAAGKCRKCRNDCEFSCFPRGGSGASRRAPSRRPLRTGNKAAFRPRGGVPGIAGVLPATRRRLWTGIRTRRIPAFDANPAGLPRNASQKIVYVSQLRNDPEQRINCKILCHSPHINPNNSPRIG